MLKIEKESSFLHFYTYITTIQGHLYWIFPRDKNGHAFQILWFDDHLSLGKPTTYGVESNLPRTWTPTIVKRNHMSVSEDRPWRMFWKSSLPTLVSHFNHQTLLVLFSPPSPPPQGRQTQMFEKPVFLIHGLAVWENAQRLVQFLRRKQFFSKSSRRS